MKARAIETLNYYANSLSQRYVKAQRYNELQEDFENNINKIDTISESTADAGTTIDGTLFKDSADPIGLLSASGTLTATEIVGTDAGDLGHASGAILVAASGMGYTYEFVSAILIYDYSVAAYTGGDDDLLIAVGANHVTGATTKANLLEATEDKIVMIRPITTGSVALTTNTTINLQSTAWTQPGTAAGVLRYKVFYRKHATGL